MYKNNLLEIFYSRPQSVASTVIQIIQNGDSGAIWVVEDDKKPVAIKPIDHYIKMSTPI